MEKDTPRKTGIPRFFEVVGRDLTGMFLANFFTCLSALPAICLVTVGLLGRSLVVMLAGAVIGGAIAGPFLAGTYDTVLRALRDEPGYWWATYRRAFRQNWKKQHPPRHPLHPGGYLPDLYPLFLLFHRGPGGQRGHRHVGGRHPEPAGVPHAVHLHVAPGGAAEAALPPDPGQQPAVHAGVFAPCPGSPR